MNHSILRNLAFYALMFFVVWTVADYMSGSHQTAQATALGYSDFTEKVTAGDVDKVVIVQNNIRGTLKDGTEFTTIAPDPDCAPDRLLVLHHAAVPDGRRAYDELRQVARAPHGER